MVEHASETVVKYANIIHRCIEEDNPHKIITSLCMMTREERKSVVSYKVNSNPALCFACLNNRLGIVKYLITECDTDIEQRGFYLEPTQNTRIEAPPLWCATVPVNGIDVVRFLVEHGADINGYSDTQSTPLRAACFENNIPLVRYLVENGADVHKTNIWNQTCLMSSVGSSELCEYLLRNGADVKSTDSYGNTALHFAVHENILDSVTVLIKYDADIYCKVNDGESLLRTAAYKGHDSIVEYLLNIGSYSGEYIVEAYDLLGAFHVDDDISKCLTVWTKALEIRSKSDLGVTHLNCITNNPDVFQNANELLTVDEVQKLTDPNDIHMQALLKYYRIYGENHVNTSSEIMYRGEVYLENGCYQTCINLWKYAYRLRFKEEDPLDRNSIYSARKVIYAFCEMQRACENSSTTDKVYHT
ncbi:protein fem-1 homolog C-like isoform X2 [Mytilus californianus]|uniref:protein fem-1 homolog C-like isoform X2 n=1 Tax=Mytilus californianus TaxID=6549 RepID=UPI002246BAA5|nr:protein fem-1 homolog C-like isoform X2 [Mytilus californianus]